MISFLTIDKSHHKPKGRIYDKYQRFWFAQVKKFGNYCR
jgi:hypothetical protein